jgi:hypothetical protein
MDSTSELLQKKHQAPILLATRRNMEESSYADSFGCEKRGVRYYIFEDFY